MDIVKLYVYQDIEDGGYMAHVPVLPGVNARRNTRAAAIDRVNEVLQEELTYLRQQDFPLPPCNWNVLSVDEPATPNLLPEDLRPLQPDELPALMQRLRLSRERLLALLASQPAARLSEQPAGGWSINTVVEHIANGELWYLDRLICWPDDPRETVAGAQRQLMQRLETLDAAARDQVSMNYGVDWTPRKVLRRAREIERAWMEYLTAAATAPAPAAMPANRWQDNAGVPEDRQPIDAATWRETLDALGALGTQLMARITALDPALLDQATAPDQPTLAAGLRRLANSLWTLKARLTAWPAETIPFAMAVRETVSARLAGLTGEDMGASQRALNGELWTARKILRRMLEHEREHYDHIRELLGLLVRTD